MSAYSSLVINYMHFSRIIVFRSPSLRATIATLFSSPENQNKSINQNYRLTTLVSKSSKIKNSNAPINEITRIPPYISR